MPSGQLEEEIRRVKTQLRAAVEQYETQAEELKASNEELQAMNEELRSSAEEIETSKEELQSVNEELQTVNQELKIKIEEQIQANDDIQNLINSTEIGTVFLDRSARIKLFTPRARDVFNLIPADRGRPLSDINSVLVNADLRRRRRACARSTRARGAGGRDEGWPLAHDARASVPHGRRSHRRRGADVCRYHRAQTVGGAVARLGRTASRSSANRNRRGHVLR